MHLLINLAVIRLSLQIVIPGIMIVFGRQQEKQGHRSLPFHTPSATPTACDGQQGTWAQGIAGLHSHRQVTGVACGSIARAPALGQVVSVFTFASLVQPPVWSKEITFISSVSSSITLCTGRLINIMIFSVKCVFIYITSFIWGAKGFCKYRPILNNMQRGHSYNPCQ